MNKVGQPTITASKLHIEAKSWSEEYRKNPAGKKQLRLMKITFRP